ncbi:predicted protein [Chaetoceros tenuissimus]|uniref:MYND-type domain-containing protein n=1 Tax=Chaetoceros tenuissimus TaxID=426638 RepID=A0AAD3H8H6_9STRA|nr:predicted protein [Chaetoceros tenuissimus]
MFSILGGRAKPNNLTSTRLKNREAARTSYLPITLEDLLKCRYVYFESRDIQTSTGFSMGKKGKKSRRQQAKKVDTDQIVIDNIMNRVKEYDERAFKSSMKNLYSDAVSSLKEAVQFVEAKEAIIVKAERGIYLFYEYLIKKTYRRLIATEYNTRRNYEEVIQICNCFTSKFNYTTAIKGVVTSSFMEESVILIMMYRDLALIRVSNDISADSSLFQDVPKYMKDADRDSATMCKEQIVSCLRATKNFGAAIDMDMKFASIRDLDEGEEKESAASLAITYIERYRVEFHKHTEEENKLEFSRLSKFIAHTAPKQKQDWDALRYNNTDLRFSHGVALAQWYYLLSKQMKSDEKMWTDLRSQAIYYVLAFIAKKWQMKDNCFYCHQAPTKDEVKLVCGDCRVACYCSIDHQRVSWKKNALDDMCFGHEAICSAMKAYRKWQEAVDVSDTEKEIKMKRRLDRECLGFLAYGLGLQDK